MGHFLTLIPVQRLPGGTLTTFYRPGYATRCLFHARPSTNPTIIDFGHFLVGRSPTAISTNEWHSVRFSRTGRNGFLQVDNQKLVQGMASGAFTQLTLTLDLYIGGHRSYDEIAKAVRVDKSFEGCIQRVGITVYLKAVISIVFVCYVLYRE